MGNTINKNISTVFIVGSLVFQGCIAYGNKEKVSLTSESKNEVLNTTLASVDVSNDVVSISGTGLSAVTAVKIRGNGVNSTLNINSKSDTQISAIAANAISLLVGKSFELILSSASAQSTYAITFTLDRMGANPGQVLKFDGTSWQPDDLASSQTYLGTWNAATQTPPLDTTPVAGDYYIVTVQGDYPSPGDTYDVGDWIIYNGSAWEKVSSGLSTKLSNNGGTLTGDLKLDTLLKFKGGSNYVTLKASSSLVSDFSLTLPTTAGASGQVLTTNGSGVLSWTTPASSTAPTGAAGGDLSGNYPDPTITALSATKIADGSVTNAKFQYLSNVTSDIQTQLNAKQSGGSFITVLTGDVTAAGPGSSAATVVEVGGVTAAQIAAGVTAANSATNANTVSTSVKRDSSGNFSAGTITATLNGTATNVTGVVAVANGGTGSSSLTLNQLLFGNGTSAIGGLAITGTPSVLLSTNITGAPAWTTSTTGNYLKATTGVGVSFGTISSSDLPSGTISGAGTTGKIPYYSAASTLADSPIAVSGTTVGVATASATPLLVESTSGTISGIEFKNTGSTGSAEGIMSSNDTILIQTGGSNRVYIGSNFGVGSSAPTGVPFYVKNSALVARFDNTTAGSSAITNNVNGVELVSGSMNTTNKYGQGLKFMSTDADFTTEPIKLLAGIFPRATETYNADTRGGMAIDFMVSPNNPGVNNLPVTAMTVDQSGWVGIGVTAPTTKLDVNGTVNSTAVTTGTITASTSVTSALGTFTTLSAGQSYVAGLSVNSSANASFNAIIQNNATNGYSATAYNDSASTTQGIIGYANASAAAFANTFFVTAFGGKALTFGIGGNELARIDTTGYFGIGTPSPTQKLHVIGNILASGTVTGSSDKRLKKNIRPIEDALTALDKITGVKYFWINPEEHNDGEQIGVIAQDVEKVFPQAVITGSDGFKSVSYMGLVAPVIQAIKELNTKFKTLVAQVTGMDSRVEKLEKENAELKARLLKIEKSLAKK